jgi:hypothetical protein
LEHLSERGQSIVTQLSRKTVHTALDPLLSLSLSR